jgi:hypothetical protein
MGVCITLCKSIFRGILQRHNPIYKTIFPYERTTKYNRNERSENISTAEDRFGVDNDSDNVCVYGVSVEAVYHDSGIRRVPGNRDDNTADIANDGSVVEFL